MKRLAINLLSFFSTCIGLEAQPLIPIENGSDKIIAEMEAQREVEDIPELRDTLDHMFSV